MEDTKEDTTEYCAECGEMEDSSAHDPWEECFNAVTGKPCESHDAHHMFVAGR